MFKYGYFVYFLAIFKNCLLDPDERERLILERVENLVRDNFIQPADNANNNLLDEIIRSVELRCE